MTDMLFHGFVVDSDGTEEILTPDGKVRGFWLESNGVIRSNPCTICLHNKDTLMTRDANCFLRVLPETFGWYTGVTINESRIYTGDKIQWSDCYGQHTGIVRMGEGEFCVPTDLGLVALGVAVQESKNRAGIKILRNRCYHTGFLPSDMLDTETDSGLEALWEEFADVPFDEGEFDEALADDWLDFKAGTEREEIWHWFDERHSKGVHWLLYGKE